MINMTTITSALQAVVLAASLPELRVTRGERINYDPGACPWCGIYPGSVRSEAHTLGGAGAQRWKSTGEVQVVLQTSDFNGDGRVASEELEALALSVCSAVNANLSLGVSGFRITPSIERDYRYVLFDEDGGGSVFMPQVALKFNFEYRSTGQ